MCCLCVCMVLRFLLFLVWRGKRLYAAGFDDYSLGKAVTREQGEMMDLKGDQLPQKPCCWRVERYIER